MSHPSGFWDTHIEGDKRAMLTTGQNTSSSPSHPELLWKLEIPVDPAALTLPLPSSSSHRRVILRNSREQRTMQYCLLLKLIDFADMAWRKIRLWYIIESFVPYTSFRPKIDNWSHCRNVSHVILKLINPLNSGNSWQDSGIISDLVPKQNCPAFWSRSTATLIGQAWRRLLWLVGLAPGDRHSRWQ